MEPYFYHVSSNPTLWTHTDNLSGQDKRKSRTTERQKVFSYFIMSKSLSLELGFTSFALYGMSESGKETASNAEAS